MTPIWLTVTLPADPPAQVAWVAYADLDGDGVPDVYVRALAAGGRAVLWRDPRWKHQTLEGFAGAQPHRAPRATWRDAQVWAAAQARLAAEDLSWLVSGVETNGLDVARAGELSGVAPLVLTLSSEEGCAPPSAELAVDRTLPGGCDVRVSATAEDEATQRQARWTCATPEAARLVVGALRQVASDTVP